MKFLLKLILALLFVMPVYSANMVDLDTLTDKNGNLYYVTNNGYLQPYLPVKRNILNEYDKPSKYQDWTYLDENGYDYTVIIEVK